MNKWNLVLHGMLFLFLVLLFLVYRELKSDGTQCLVNPLNYSIYKLSDEAGADMSCTCSFNSQKFSSFRVSKTGVEALDIRITSPSANLSGLEKVFVK